MKNGSFPVPEREDLRPLRPSPVRVYVVRDPPSLWYVLGLGVDSRRPLILRRTHCTGGYRDCGGYRLQGDSDTLSSCLSLRLGDLVDLSTGVTCDSTDHNWVHVRPGSVSDTPLGSRGLPTFTGRGWTQERVRTPSKRIFHPLTPGSNIRRQEGGVGGRK